MFLAVRHKGRHETSPCACSGQHALHGWDPNRDPSITLTDRQGNQPQEVTTLSDAADQIADLQRELAAKQVEIDVLSEALDYARGIVC
jgi:hypothetical protein